MESMRLPSSFMFSSIKLASRSSISNRPVLLYPASSPACQSCSMSFVSLRNLIPRGRRNLSIVAGSNSGDVAHQHTRFKGSESFFRSVLASMEAVYLNRNPTSKAVLDCVHSVDDSQICYDHIAFRTFGEIIVKYTEMSCKGNNYAALASALGSVPWGNPLFSEFQQLARESEYAAWTLVNGYAVNHVTISSHRLKSHLRNIKSLNQFLEESGFKLNSEGGVLKVSPDGLLLQSSTVADSIPFRFSDGITESVPCSYIEFAERLVLPQFRNLPEEEVEEFHRRDGFAVGNADKIFESTSKGQLNRREAA